MPVERDLAWAHLQDIDMVAACIPGLIPGSVEQLGNDRFRGTLRHLALGIPSRWQLEAHVTRSEADRMLAVHLDGAEERLDLTLIGDARLAVGSGEGGGARLDYTGDLTVTGRLAGVGGPIIERVVASIVERFVESVGNPGAARPAPSRWARFVARLKSFLPWRRLS